MIASSTGAAMLLKNGPQGWSRIPKISAPSWTRSLYFSRSVPSANPVALSYKKLASGFEQHREIEAAFGFHGLGLVVVKDIPQFSTLRRNLLPLIHKFANFPPEKRKKMENAESEFGVGWAHGKEKFPVGGVQNLFKAAYKANPVTNTPTDDANLRQQYPFFAHANVWPTEDLPELEEAFLKLGRLVVDIGKLVAKECDSYMSSKIKDWPREGAGSMLSAVSSVFPLKGRGLHYYPPPTPSKDTPIQEWVGWHNDVGSLTGLTSAIYIDKDGNEVVNPDPRTGLVVAPRAGSPYTSQVKVSIPHDALAFQIGEYAQIISGGHLRATPHMVKSPANVQAHERGVGRSTFAVFMQPELSEVIALPHHTLPNALESNPWVPPLATRWTAGQPYSVFCKKTLECYAKKK